MLRGIQLGNRNGERVRFFDLVPGIPGEARRWREVNRIGWEPGLTNCERVHAG